MIKKLKTLVKGSAWLAMSWLWPALALAGGFPSADVKGKSLAESGNWLNVIRVYIGQGGVIIGLALSVLAFVWVGYSALTKFNEAREGRAEWSELAVLAVAGAVILIFVAILLSQTGTATSGLESTVGT